MAPCRLFLGPGFRLGARWNRLGETVKTRKRRINTGRKWARYGLKGVKESGSPGAVRVGLCAEFSLSELSHSSRCHSTSTCHSTNPIRGWALRRCAAPRPPQTPSPAESSHRSQPACGPAPSPAAADQRTQPPARSNAGQPRAQQHRATFAPLPNNAFDDGRNRNPRSTVARRRKHAREDAKGILRPRDFGLRSRANKCCAK